MIGLVGAGLGFLLGAVVGAVIGDRTAGERWQTVPVPRSGVSLQPGAASDGSLELRISLPLGG